MVHKPRNSLLAPGIERFSRSQVYRKKALYKKFPKPKAAAPAAAAPLTKQVPVNGAKNGKTRVVAVTKAPKFYPAEDVAVPKKARKTQRPSTLRSSITPGTVLVLLAGRFRGKRVVFLKQLPSGLLLVTGPYKVNGVPMRRVNQAYVLATTTKVDVSKVKLPETVNDAYFKKAAEKKAKKPTEEGLFADKTKKEVKPVDAKRAQDQKAVDAALLAEIKKVAHLKSYLSASFSLKKGQAPHLMKF